MTVCLRKAILYDMTTTSTRPGIRTVLGYGVTYLMAKPTEPVRPVTGCATCNDGCECEDGIGCEHWCCWDAKGDLANTCPSAQPLREHMHAYMQYRKDLYAYDMQSHLR